MIIKVKCPLCGGENPTMDRVLNKLIAQNAKVVCRVCKKESTINQWSGIPGAAQPAAPQVQQPTPPIQQPSAQPQPSYQSQQPVQPQQPFRPTPPPVQPQPVQPQPVRPTPPPVQPQPVQPQPARPTPPPAAPVYQPQVQQPASVGRLRLVSTGQTFDLKKGVNIIGRKVVNAPHADIEVPCPSKSTSRQHLMLVAKEQPGAGYTYFISLYKEEVNDTRIGQQLLTFGNTVVMREGDIIHLPDVDLQLEVPNDEATCLA